MPRSREHGLRKESYIVRMLEAARPEIVIHLPAVVGGTGANRENPGRLFYDNLVMGVRFMSGAGAAPRRRQVSPLWGVPELAPVPFREEDLWNGHLPVPVNLHGSGDKFNRGART